MRSVATVRFKTSRASWLVLPSQPHATVASDPSGGTGGLAPDNDTALVALVAQGDRDAFANLYDRYAPNVYGLAMRILRNAPDAESLVSDVFLELWRKPERFDASRGAFRTYLLTLTRCRGIDRLRAHATRADKTAAAGDESANRQRDRQDAGSPLQLAVAGEHGRFVREAVSELDDNQRVPLELAFFDGLTHQEIAERLDTPLGTIKTRIRTGLRTLRGALAKIGGAT